MQTADKRHERTDVRLLARELDRITAAIEDLEAQIANAGAVASLSPELAELEDALTQCRAVARSSLWRAIRQIRMKVDSRAAIA